MNKTVQSIIALTAFSALLIAITLFCGGLGFGRLFGIYGIMEYCLLGMLVIIDILVIYKVYKLYAMQPKTIMLLLGLECCSILLWLAFICIDQSLLDWQITNFILQAVCLDGFTGDERGLNMLAVLCGIVYPLIGIGCLFTGLGFVNKLVTTKIASDGVPFQAIMNKGIKNTDNYFERVKQRANRTNYRYYFFDYLYFKGEVWGKKIGRMSGFILLFWYWWWVVVLPGNFLLINSVPEWSSLHLGYLGAMFLLICVFILARYRKARVQALLNRYRRSKHISAVQAYFLFLLPFVLFFLETWLFDEWGWTDCVRWNK